MIHRLLIIVWVIALMCLFAMRVRSRHVTDTFSYLSGSDTDHTLVIGRDDFTLGLQSHATSLPPTANPIHADQRKPGWSHTRITEPEPEDIVQYTSPGIIQPLTTVGFGSLSLPGSFHHFLGMKWLWFQVSWPALKGTGLIVQRSDFISVSYWWVLVVLLLPAVTPIRRAFRRRRRASHNHCVHCGYDLRGSGNHCPECGNTSARAGPKFNSPHVP